MSEESRSIPKQQTWVYLALMALFGLTFWLAHLDLGRLQIVAGLGIAAAKAALVAIYFMDLRRSSGIHRVAAGVGVFWLGILLVLALTDYVSRGWLELPSLWP